MGPPTLAQREALDRLCHSADLLASSCAEEVGCVDWHKRLANKKVDYEGGALRSGEVYDPVTEIWASLPPMRKPREGFSLVALGAELWAIGDNGDVERYDTAAGSWSIGPRHSLARCQAAAVLEPQ